MTPEQIKPDKRGFYRSRITGELGRVLVYDPHNGPLVVVDLGPCIWTGNYVDFWEDWIHEEARQWDQLQEKR